MNSVDDTFYKIIRQDTINIVYNAGFLKRLITIYQ